MRLLLSVILILVQVFVLEPQPMAGQNETTADGGDRQEAVLSGGTEKQLQRLDRQVLLELIKLAQLNVHYQQSVNHYSRWRTVLYPLAQEAAYACFFGYNVTDITQESRGWYKPKVISSTALKKGLSSATSGAILGAGSSMAELALNGVESIHCSKENFSSRKSTILVQSELAQIEQLLRQRKQLMSSYECSGKKKELLELKEQLLEYERDRLVFEFRRWNAHSCGYAWYRNSFYVINAMVNLIRLSAITVGYKSFSNKRFSGGIGPQLICSASLAGMGPALSSRIGNWRKDHVAASLAKTFGTKSIFSDSEAKIKMGRLAELLMDPESGQEHGILLSELVRLREEKLGLDKLIEHEERIIQRTRVVAGQQAKAAPIISCLTLSSGILGTIGYYRYRQRPVLNNRLGFAGDAATISAEAVALYATPAAAIKAGLYERSLRKQGLHPSQVLSARHTDLQKLENLLKYEMQRGE